MKPGKLEMNPTGDGGIEWSVIFRKGLRISSSHRYVSKHMARVAARAAIKKLGLEIENTTAVKPR